MRTLEELIDEYHLYAYPTLEQFVDSQSAICNRIDEIFDSTDAPSGWENHWPPAQSREVYKEVEMFVTEKELKLLFDEYMNKRNPSIQPPEPETIPQESFEMKIEFGLLRTLYQNNKTIDCIDEKCVRTISLTDQCFIDTETSKIYCYECGVNERFVRKNDSLREGPPRKIIGIDI